MLQGPLLLNLADQEQTPPSCSSLPSSAGVSLPESNAMPLKLEFASESPGGSLNNGRQSPTSLRV